MTFLDQTRAIPSTGASRFSADPLQQEPIVVHDQRKRRITAMAVYESNEVLRELTAERVRGSKRRTLAEGNDDEIGFRCLRPANLRCLPCVASHHRASSADRQTLKVRGRLRRLDHLTAVPRECARFSENKTNGATTFHPDCGVPVTSLA